MDHIMNMLNAFISKLAGKDADPRYRPERHYMRGPGPKAKAKACDPTATQTSEDTAHARAQRPQTRRA